MGRPRGPFKPPLNMDGRQDFHPSLPEKFDVSCVDVNRHGKEAEDSVYTHMPTRNIRNPLMLGMHLTRTIFSTKSQKSESWPHVDTQTTSVA